MELLERQTQVAELDAALRDARSGRGSVVLVTGEAGAGKTSLLRRFSADVGAESNVLWGMCDELATPRVLGPFRDMVSRLGDTSRQILGSDQNALLDAVIQEMGQSPRGTVVVVEDAHWADAATADGIRFLGRRVRHIPAVLIVTFRADEVPVDHPVRLAVGAVAPDDVRRIALLPLSPRGVAQLADRDEVDDLYRLTGGNPFFVKEVLADPDATVPPTVQEAALARVRRLSDRGRAAVEVAAVVPGSAERWILDGCGVGDGVDGAAAGGVLEVGDAVRFAHELVRRAVEVQLAPARRIEINKRVLSLLIDADADPARLTHHAIRANDAVAIARFAPLAAERAASFDSHREAAAHYGQALEQASQYGSEDLARLWYRYARECHVLGRHDTAEEALGHAVELLEEIGDHEHLGISLSLLSETLWHQGRGIESHALLERATRVLEEVAPGEALAWTYAQRARLAMVDWRAPDAIVWGEKAIELASRVGALTAHAHALNSVGMVRWMGPSGDSHTAVQSLEFARANDLTAAVGRAYINLVSGHLERLAYVKAGQFLDEGLSYCSERDMLIHHTWLLAHRSTWHLEQGRWLEAEEDAEQALTSGETVSFTALLTRGLLQSRRGSPMAESTLDEVRLFAERTGDNQVLIPAGMAMLEWAWLNGQLASKANLAAELRELARNIDNHRFDLSAIWFWLHRAGAVDETPPDLFEPHVQQIVGDWRAAATSWREIGRPYAEADALAGASEPDSLMAALEILDGLGARPLAAMVRAKLTELGVTHVPRGPRLSTRSSPAGLTTRQTEVLGLLAHGLTYHEIADQLFLSVKTVDHHAAAVRAKLGVTTRDEAVALARRKGILQASEA